jgi:1-acyl-sn-glycerol-3-phosphate acyltransferase
LSQSSPPARDLGRRLKRLYIRFCLRLWIRWYLRVRLIGLGNLPTGTAYLLCFSHPNWIDPFLLAGFWPDKPHVFIFGPREEAMTVGWRNRLITWSGIAVPFKPSKADLLDTTRRAMSVLKRGDVLAIAGEGRLSDREGAIVPLQDGAAFLALRAGVPIVPLAIIGTRWLHFGKKVTLKTGAPIEVEGLPPNRQGVATLTSRIQERMDRLLEGVEEDPPPGPFGRWVTDLFNERPWLTERSAGGRDAVETRD